MKFVALVTNRAEMIYDNMTDSCCASMYIISIIVPLLYGVGWTMGVMVLNMMALFSILCTGLWVVVLFRSIYIEVKTLLMVKNPLGFTEDVELYHQRIENKWLW